MLIWLLNPPPLPWVLTQFQILGLLLLLLLLLPFCFPFAKNRSVTKATKGRERMIHLLRTIYRDGWRADIHMLFDNDCDWTGYKRWRNKVRKEELELLEHVVSELGWSHSLQILIRLYSLISGWISLSRVHITRASLLLKSLIFSHISLPALLHHY